MAAREDLLSQGGKFPDLATTPTAETGAKGKIIGERVIPKDWTVLTEQENPPLDRDLADYSKWRRDIAARVLPEGTHIERESLQMEISNAISEETAKKNPDGKPKYDQWQTHIVGQRIAGELITGKRADILRKAKDRALRDEYSQWDMGMEWLDDKPAPLSVEAYKKHSNGKPLPDGFVKEGDRYVFKPKPAAEAGAKGTSLAELQSKRDATEAQRKAEDARPRKQGLRSAKAIDLQKQVEELDAQIAPLKDAEQARFKAEATTQESQARLEKERIDKTPLSGDEKTELESLRFSLEYRGNLPADRGARLRELEIREKIAPAPAAETVAKGKPVETGVVDTIAGRMGLSEFENKGYAPEQVTRQNWIDLQRAERRRLGQQEGGDNRNAPWAEYENFHEDAVKRALAKGEEVDSQVLADYPNLAPTTQPAPKPVEQMTAEEQAQVSDDVTWRTGAGDMARATVQRISKLPYDAEPMADVDWFGVKRVPVSQLRIVKKSSRRVFGEQSAAKSAAAQTPQTVAADAPKAVRGKVEVKVRNPYGLAPENEKIQTVTGKIITLDSASGHEFVIYPTGKYWRVVEKTTGSSFGNETKTTQKDAIESAEFALRSVKPGLFNQVVKDAEKLNPDLKATPSPAATAPQPAAVPTEGVGSIYTGQLKGEPAWVVQQGEKKGVGDTIWRSRSEAEKESAGTIKRIARRAEILKEEEAAKAKAAADLAEQSKLDGFEEGMTPVQLGRARKVLSETRTIWNGKEDTRRNHIKRLVNEGRTIDVGPNGKRRLITPDGSFFGEDQTTKLGMDYAAHLIENRNEEAQVAVEQPAPALPSEPARVQLRSGPQTYTIEEQLPAHKGDQPGEVYFRVKNEKTGEVQTVESGDLKPVKGKAGAQAQADPVEAILTRAIDATNPQGKTFDFVSGVSHAVAHTALKIARAVYISTRDMAAAVRAAVAHMRDNATEGFNEAKAEAKVREALGEGRSDSSIWEIPNQEITSADTSINERKTPATFSKVSFEPGTKNADIGGGRFDNATELLSKIGVENVIFDPFNRSRAENEVAVGKISNGQSDTATVNNVLNVISDPENRDRVIAQAADAIKEDGTAYFLIYEGDKTGTGRVTKSANGVPGSWQENRSAASYVNEISDHFSEVSRSGNLIAARGPIKETAKVQKALGNTKASKRNSLRVRLSREALTDLALSQAKWRDWYKEHQDTLDAFFGSDAGLFQKILAITSQAASVKANVGLALKAFAQFKQGLDFDGKTRGEESSGYLPAVIGNLNALRAETQIQGRKIGAYTSANEGKTDSVVVDRHIARMLFGVDTPSAAQYAKASKVLTEIANELGWEPRQVQAALWAASIVKSGKEPQSYGQYLRTLHSRGTLKERIGHVVDRSSEVHGNGGLGVADSGGVQEADGGGKQPEADAVEGFFNRAIEVTDPRGKAFDFVSGVSYAVANAALKIARAVYIRTRDMASAVRAAVEHIRENSEIGFDEAAAESKIRETLSSEPAIQPPAAAPGARTQESRGQFTGLITRDGAAQWSEAAAGWIKQFNGDLNAATVAAIGGELPSDVRQFVFGQLLELTNQAIATTKNPVERNQLLNLQARQADAMKDSGALGGKTLAARFLAMKAIEHIMPVLLYRGLVRKAQLQAIPFTSVTSDAVRSWLTQAGRQAVAETREAMTKANAVVARVLKQQVSDYGQTWRDIVTASTEAQGNHRAEIFKRIAAHPALQGLDQASQIELTNLLSDAWERERMKIFRAEFRKMVPLPKKTKEVDAKKLFDAIPDLVKQANLGLLDDEQFRDALAKRYGVASVNDATARRLNEMAQQAQKAPSGVMRSRILSQMVDLIQVAGGISKAHVLRDYWYAAVLSSPRTQVDNGMALLNGALMTALASARDPQAAPFVWRAFTSGLAEAGRDFVPILQGERWRMSNIDIDRPASVLDALQKSPNYAAKALGSFAYVGRLIAALDHLNTLATREAMLAWAIHRSTDGDAREMMRPGPQDIAAARERAVQEGTPAALVQKRTREILEERISPELLLSATTIGQEAAYQSEPYGFLGYFYRAIKGLDKLPYVGGVSRILSGTAFARYAVNASNDMLNYAAPIALFRWYVSATERQATSKLNFTPEQRDLILMKAALGTVAATAAAAAFLGGGDDDKKKRAIDIQGSFRSLEGPKRNQLLAEGNIPYSIRIGNTYVSYRQLPVAAILGTIGEMRDRQKYQPDQWKEESVAANIGNGAIAGMFLVRDSAAISSFMDFLGVANAYKYDVKGISEKSIPRYVSKMLGSLVPNAAKDVEAWVDPSLYRGNSAGEYFLQQLPLARQLAGEGPLLNLFGEPVQADKYPWSRWVSGREVSPEWEAAGNLAARGLFLPQVAGFSVTNDDGTRRKATPRELYAYQREVGAGYKEFIRENAAELQTMDAKEAADFIKRETSAIRRGVRFDIQP